MPGSISPSALRELIDRGAAPAILDVRSAAEFAAGHVPGAVHVPFHAVAAHAEVLPPSPDAAVVVYCGHGPRAWIAARALRARGFSNIRYLKGHWRGWRRELATKHP